MIFSLRILNKLHHGCRMMSSANNNGFKNVVVDATGGIMTIGINRPERKNAVDHDTAKELVQAFQQFERDHESKVAVLYGKGGTFCAGYDLKSLASADPSVLQSIGSDEIAPMGPSRMCFNKPVIASIDGHAVAGGLELALLCDLRVMEESAIMGVYCRRFGVPLVDGGTVRLQKLIGLSRAMDLILTGRAVTAKEAFDIGLANRITAVGSGLSTAIKLATTIIRFPQQCMNADRRSAYNAAYSARSMDEAMQYEFDNGIKVVTEESIPGAQKFAKGIGKHGSFNINPSGRPKL